MKTTDLNFLKGEDAATFAELLSNSGAGKATLGQGVEDQAVVIGALGEGEDQPMGGVGSVPGDQPAVGKAALIQRIKQQWREMGYGDDLIITIDNGAVIGGPFREGAHGAEANSPLPAVNHQPEGLAA